MSPVILHAAGGTSGTAFIVVAAFIFIVALCFVLAPPSEGSKLSPAFALTWLKASLPRLAVAGLFSAFIILASTQLGHSGVGTVSCDQSVPPLSQNTVTSERLDGAIVIMRQLATVAASGDQTLADSLFFGDAHNVTHDIDGPLRAENPDLAKELCRNVVVMEEEFAGARRLDIIAGEAETVAGILAEAGRELGLTH